jgi:hypothetical protein
MKIALLDVNNGTLPWKSGFVSDLVYAEPKKNLKTGSLSNGIEVSNPNKV